MDPSVLAGFNYTSETIPDVVKSRGKVNRLEEYETRMYKTEGSRVYSEDGSRV